MIVVNILYTHTYIHTHMYSMISPDRRPTPRGDEQILIDLFSLLAYIYIYIYIYVYVERERES